MAAKANAKTPAQQRALLYSLLGDLPPRDRKIRARRVSHEERASYVLERWVPIGAQPDLRFTVRANVHASSRSGRARAAFG